MATITQEQEPDVLATVPVDPPSAATVSTLQPVQVQDDAEAQPNRSNLAIWAILIALYLSEFIAALDTTITATSVPVICADLHSSSGYLWIGGAFMLACAAGEPIWAKLSDIFGRKPALVAAVLLFAVGSILAATSASMGQLIAGRAVQGAAGGGIMALVSITISDIFSVRQRSLYLGITDFVWVTAGAIGPILGGVFTQLLSWRWNFFINLPVCGLSLVLLVFFLDVYNPRTPLAMGLKAIDWFGTVSILAVTLMVLLGLDFGGAVYPWTSTKVIALIIAGLASIGLFVYSEKKLAKYPLMPLNIFKNRSTTAAFGLVCCHGIVQMGTEYYLPLYFQSVRGASPLRSGILILPLIIFTATGSGLGGVFIHQTGKYREVIWVGTLVLTIGIGLFVMLGVRTATRQIVGFEILEGFAAGLLFQPPLVAVQAVVRQAETAGATATLGFMREVANCLGLVLGGVVFQNGMDARAQSLRAAGLNDTLVAAFSSSQAAASVELIKGIADKAQMDAVKEAYSWSLRNTWIMYTCFAALASVIGGLVKHRDLSREHTEMRTGLDGMERRDD